MSQTKTLQKVLNLFLIVSLFALTPHTALAGLFGGGGVKIPSASSIASEMERRYNLDLGNIQNQSQYFNVSDNKKPTPEVTIYFTPSDPRPGQKITARAFTSYFTNQPGTLYYTWYLKRDGCDLTRGAGPASDRALALCDHDGDDEVTEEDWKIEAARIIASNNFDTASASYGSDTDDDGYRAKFGGDSKANVANHCYVHDPATGTNYELGKGSNVNFSCPTGKAVCMVGREEVSSGTNNAAGGNSYFDVEDSDQCYVSGLPACSDGAPLCNTGVARCLTEAEITGGSSCGTAVNTCSADTEATAQPYCRHLFPDAPDRTSGDGSFGAAEERFWRTNSQDPDTAGNGNKDEANVVGLDQETFTWNYNSEDQVGVAVEGTSLFATKHDDSSAMIMWAFSKNDCPISLTDASGAYVKRIKGYLVTIPTADFDLNKCLERNLVDPLEGGQATNLEVSVSSVPEAPVNDESGDGGGDLVSVQASVGNTSQPLSNSVFTWKVEMSNNIQFNSAVGTTADVTDDLSDLGFIGNTQGNALNTLRLKMDIPSSGASLGGRPLSRYLINGIGYLRFTAAVSENFSSGITRRGQSDVIVKFTSTGRKITAYKPDPELVGGAMQVSLPGASGIICQNDPLERTLCPVMKNEIIGMRIDPSGLDNFHWTVNGQTLVCTREGMSPDCGSGEQNEVNFIPVTGNPGDTYTVNVTANDVATGSSVTVNRTFHVVEPEAAIESVNNDVAWPKLLGQYRDITGTATGCPDGLCNDYSTTIFETATGNDLAFRARFLPGFLSRSVEREWSVDNVPIQESVSGEIRFTANKPAPSVYNITLAAQSVQSPETRRALLDIWGISPLETPEKNFSVTSQVEVGDGGLASGPFRGTQKYLAAVASYIPATLLFSFRILLAGILIIFATSFLFALLPPKGRETKQ